MRVDPTAGPSVIVAVVEPAATPGPLVLLTHSADSTAFDGVGCLGLEVGQDVLGLLGGHLSGSHGLIQPRLELSGELLDDRINCPAAGLDDLDQAGALPQLVHEVLRLDAQDVGGPTDDLLGAP